MICERFYILYNLTEDCVHRWLIKKRKKDFSGNSWHIVLWHTKTKKKKCNSWKTLVWIKTTYFDEGLSRFKWFFFHYIWVMTQNKFITSRFVNVIQNCFKTYTSYPDTFVLSKRLPRPKESSIEPTEYVYSCSATNSELT